MVRNWNRRALRVAGIFFILVSVLLLTPSTAKASEFTELILAENGFYVYSISAWDYEDIFDGSFQLREDADYQAFIDKLADRNDSLYGIETEVRGVL